MRRRWQDLADEVRAKLLSFEDIPRLQDRDVQTVLRGIELGTIALALKGADERIAAVQTGGCPHTAIRDDITANLDAIDDLIEGNDKLDLILVESGGDNLTATFSSGLVDVQIFVVDVAGGEDRKSVV